MSVTISVIKLFGFLLSIVNTEKRNYVPTCINVVKGLTKIGTLKTSNFLDYQNNKVSFAWLNSFSGFLLSSKTTIFQIGNFLLHLAVVTTLNRYTEDDTLTSTL